MRRPQHHQDAEAAFAFAKEAMTLTHTPLPCLAEQPAEAKVSDAGRKVYCSASTFLTQYMAASAFVVMKPSPGESYADVRLNYKLTIAHGNRLS
jgi:hypothetical protein